MVSLIKELLEENGSLLEKIMVLLEGREARADINLNGMELKAGKTRVKLAGVIKVTVSQSKKK